MNQEEKKFEKLSWKRLLKPKGKIFVLVGETEQ